MTRIKFAEDAESWIRNAALDQDYPNVSPILGSDWGVNYPMVHRTPEEYVELAVRHAHRIFPSYWG